MNYFLIFMLAICSIHSASCNIPEKLCQDSIFSFDNKDVNAYFRLEMGISQPGSEKINLDQSKNNSFHLINYSKILNKIRKLDKDEEIKKVKESKPRLDQGYVDEAVCPKGFLGGMLQDLIPRKHEDQEKQSLILDNGKIEVYYDKQILKLIEFTLFYDKDHKKETGYLVSYYIYVPVNLKDYTPDGCNENKDLPGFFKNKGK